MHSADQQQLTRYASLDAFRGLTIMLMILVNSPGSWNHVYAPFRHAEWHGCTLTDLVFPFFLFIVGSAMYFSLGRTGFEPGRKTLERIGKRTILIFAIGLSLNAASSYTWSSDFRIMGVLQRIAIAYLIASLIVLFGSGRRAVLASIALLLLGYWAILIAYGGESPYALETNAVRIVDLHVLGAAHMYSMNGVPFDPEGLLSTAPVIATVLIGFEATRYLASIPERTQAAVRLALLGVLLAIAGWAWGQLWPINKALWTGSYVLYTGGWALMVLASFVYLMDVRGFNFRPLQAFGLNPLFLYALSWLWILGYQLVPVGGQILFDVVFGVFLAGEEPSKAASILFAASHVALFWGIAAILHRYRIVIKV
jgi:predicted acyltransferase